MPIQIITIIGPPGAGKDTQAELLCKKINCYHAAISTVLSQYYPKIKESATYKQGNLFGDQLIFSALDNKLQTISKQNPTYDFFIITGLPRKLSQAQRLIKNYRNSQYYYLTTISLLVSQQQAIARTRQRLVCPVCGRTYHPRYKPPKRPGVCDYDHAKLVPRQDDTYKTTIKRFRDFAIKYLQIRPYLQKYNALIELNGNQSINNIHMQILKILDRFSKSSM